ncbi:Aldo/keto reductase [Sporormia fimetaria CBS 119925]|uniref:Aldo/keto reductase n=1 Tax=Sporormia fimetaria CBS 119925 TaxID=1340428 RepID=A0A6A6V9P2_9PLEO|nr:Aldo/keto reductase [Sporormia fimetaria CBS 119925]
MPTQFKLNTGAQIPAIGFGTWQDADAQHSAVITALKAGCKHIDTAHVYGTEKAVGQGIKDSGIPRDQVFITTKLWNNAHHPDDVEKQLDKSLSLLGVEYVDLWLMHWPSAFARGEELFPKDGNGKIKTGDVDFVDTYKAMEKCLEKGKVKAIGVSNFSKAEMERLLKETSVVPAAHQIELHPWLQQTSFTDWHAQKGIQIVAYSPFGNQNEVYDKGKNMGKLIEDPVLVEIGKKHGKTGAQVALAWGITRGHCVIPKSKTEHRIKENLESDFKLDDEEMTKIEKIDKKLRFNDPSESFGYKYYADLDGK